MSNETKHTPGPWRVVQEHDSGPWGKIRVAERRYIRIEGRSKEEAEANTNLVVVAPEMLELIKEIADDTTHPIKGDFQGRMRILIGKAEAH